MKLLLQHFRPGNGDIPPRVTVIENVEYATPYAREPEEKVPLGTTTTTTIANTNPYSKCVKLNLTTKPNMHLALLSLTLFLNVV